MARILGIDYGVKRTGLAVTDPLQIIVSPLLGIETEQLEPYLVNYVRSEHVEKIVFGFPRHSDDTPTQLVEEIQQCVNRLKQQLPELIIDFQEESFTTLKAKSIMHASGMKKMKRRDKSTIDIVSAVVILQEYLGHI